VTRNDDRAGRNDHDRHDDDRHDDGDGGLAETNEIAERVYRAHGPVLDRLRILAASDGGTTEGRDEPGGRPAGAVFPSVIDPAMQVQVTATNIPLERLTQFTGHYPELSRLVIVTVAARRIREGAAADLNGAEADAWATALAPEGFGEFVIRLGVMTGSTGRAVHYRYVLGPDHHICALGEHDIARMRGDYRQ
jgi:hypothetical protein